MAKKNIERTVLEGGKRRGRKGNRKLRMKEERSAYRNWEADVRNNPEEAEGKAAPKRKKECKEFTGKLSPVRRWLKSHVGKKWDDVYSELRFKFHSKSLAAYHIIEQRVRRMVQTSKNPPEFWYYVPEFNVDDDGILRESKDAFTWNARKAIYNKKHKTNKEFVKWLDNRKVIDYGNSLFWAKPLKKAWIMCPSQSTRFCPVHKKKHKMTECSTREEIKYNLNSFWGHTLDYIGIPMLLHEEVVAWEQGARFTEEDRERWLSVHENIRKNHLVKVTL